MRSVESQSEAASDAVWTDAAELREGPDLSGIIGNGQRFALIGDSITDCDRRGSASPLGGGYVRYFVDKFTAHHPDIEVDFANKGVSGNTTRHLRERWEDDVIALRPNWLSILVGINDCHRTAWSTPEAVPADEFRSNYDELLARTISTLDCRIVLIQPFYISRDLSGTGERSRILELLPSYLDVVSDLSVKYGALLVRAHELFQRQLDFRYPDCFCPEPIHPNATGHVLLAEWLYNTLAAAGVI